MRHRQDSWIAKQWRPLAAITYLLINICDFIAFPIANGIFYYIIQQPAVPWTPLTLQGAGMLHISFGAILGVTAWGRTKEKVLSINTPIQNLTDKEK